MTVNHGVLISCRNDEGETLKGVTACGGLAGFDAIVQPRLRKLSTCPATTAATSGKLSVVFSLDFASHKVAADVGKSSTVSDSQGFATCVKGAFQGVSLGALDHQNPRYAIAYNVLFTPTDHGESQPSGPSDGIPAVTATPTGKPASSTPGASAAKAPMDDSNAEVAWDVAIVRDSPRTGSVLARLPRGTKVHLGANQEGWYKIQYGAGTEGWVYRAAIGR
jgi:Bacterial SH3 domain